MNVSVYIGASVDGFIARPDGGIDWLDQGGGDEHEDYGWAEFISTVDVLVMGRNTFELALTFGAWPYDVPVVVLSRTLTETPQHLEGRVRMMSGTPAEIVARLGAEGANHLYVDGGVTLQGFLNAGLVTELIVTRVPVLIGQGIPLFGPLAADIRLEHVATRTWDTGLVRSTYRVR